MEACEAQDPWGSQQDGDSEELMEYSLSKGWWTQDPEKI